METDKRTFLDMNTDELYAYALGAGNARSAIIQSEAEHLAFLYDPYAIRLNIPDDVQSEYTQTYIKGFRDVAAEAISKTAQREVA